MPPQLVPNRARKRSPSTPERRAHPYVIARGTKAGPLDLCQWSPSAARNPDARAATVRDVSMSTDKPATSGVTFPGLFASALEYLVDTGQRSVLFLDVMRER